VQNHLPQHRGQGRQYRGGQSTHTVTLTLSFSDTLTLIVTVTLALMLRLSGALALTITATVTVAGLVNLTLTLPLFVTVPVAGTLTLAAQYSHHRQVHRRPGLCRGAHALEGLAPALRADQRQEGLCELRLG
jgi:hypothetical protein